MGPGIIAPKITKNLPMSPPWRVCWSVRAPPSKRQRGTPTKPSRKFWPTRRNQSNLTPITAMRSYPIQLNGWFYCGNYHKLNPGKETKSVGDWSKLTAPRGIVRPPESGRKRPQYRGEGFIALGVRRAGPTRFYPANAPPLGLIAPPGNRTQSLPDNH